jgi:serine/threonine protein kinase
MASDSWGEIEELFFRGLHASDTERRRLLDGVDAQVAAPVVQLWADAVAAPSGFLNDRRESEIAGHYKITDVVEGRFRLDTLLGTGGMGQVFGAVDTRLDRPVALKFLTPRLVKHPAMRGLLQREARAVSRLAGHPNICTLHDLYWDGETPFLVMELLTGEPLAARLARGPLPVESAVAIGLAIVEGLVHAHSRGVIHRDLKPGNVMLTPFGPKLFDFGIAKRVEPAIAGDASILAPPGTFVGSVSYTSPEQAEGLALDARSDIFSVGCVLYEMVTGGKAFDGASRLSILSAVLRAEPAPIRGIDPSIPLDYVSIVDKCIQKAPSLRFQRTADLRDALDRLARSGFDQPDETEDDRRVPPPPARARKPLMRERSADVRASTAPEVAAIAHEAAVGMGGFVARPGDAEPSIATTSWQDVLRPAAGLAASQTEPHARYLARGVLARGHAHPIVLMLSVIYGLMVGLALLVEIAYEWSAFGSWALPIAAGTSVASIAVSAAGYAVLRWGAADRRPRALLAALAIFVGWSALLALAIGPQLPDRPLVRANIQTMTANVGYPKSLLEALALPLLAMLPLHAVCALEAELRRGRGRSVYRILSSRHHRLSIPGTLLVRPGVAGIVFGTVTIWWIGANGRLLENLQSGPYYGLFLRLGVARVASGLLMLLAVLAWYTWTLNELRQEAQENGRH